MQKHTSEPEEHLICVCVVNLINIGNVADRLNVIGHSLKAFPIPAVIEKIAEPARTLFDFLDLLLVFLRTKLRVDDLLTMNDGGVTKRIWWLNEMECVVQRVRLATKYERGMPAPFSSCVASKILRTRSWFVIQPMTSVVSSAVRAASLFSLK